MCVICLKNLFKYNISKVMVLNIYSKKMNKQNCLMDERIGR